VEQIIPTVVSDVPLACRREKNVIGTLAIRGGLFGSVKISPESAKKNGINGSA